MLQETRKSVEHILLSFKVVVEYNNIAFHRLKRVEQTLPGADVFVEIAA